ncbi:hypothetical protein [Pseudoflavonifractor phocaeensis]|uniref:hypothetical protein n=1 Tax=Pseudoflavonifractor phocaeensis TaxID=1870988 RepID=UPI001957CB85|nr:hypothetical protein [Pseudoflavonifractor phocaeensis]MBM6725430.1 hypothetical protein [Pseudoflavonifractor phocaeensis]
MQDLHGDARGLIIVVPAAAGSGIASINAPPNVEWGTCISLQGGDIRTLMLIDSSGLWFQYKSALGWGKWTPIANATPPQVHNLPLLDGYSLGVDGAGYSKTQEGIVCVLLGVWEL